MFLRVDPVPRAYPYLVGLWVSAGEVVGDAVLGLAVLADQSLIAGAYYHALARPWGPSLRSDQVIGGGALWVLGDIVGLPFLAAQFIQMIREDETEAAGVDAELDAVEAAERPRRRARSRCPGRRDPRSPAPRRNQPGSQPWWERDPRFADRFRSAGDSVAGQPAAGQPGWPVSRCA